MPPLLIPCPKCGAKVPEKNFCVRCGESLVQTVNKDDALGQILDFRNFERAAGAMKQQFANITLARLQFLSMPPDGAIPPIKDIRVTREAHVFFAPSEHSDLAALPLGTYTGKQLFTDAGWATTLQKSQTRNFCLFVHLNSQPMTVTFQLPDWEHMKPINDLQEQTKNFEVSHQDFKKTLEQLNIRSADFFFGGAQVQLKLRISNPTRFLETLADYIVEAAFPEEKRQEHNERRHGAEDAKRNKEYRGVFGFVKSLWKRATQLLRGKDPAKSTLVNKEFKLAEFYTRIRVEFAQAVQQAVRNLQATDLLENKDETRRAVRDDIKRFMQATLEAYGMEVVEVPAFEFLCPDLFGQQRAQGEIELRKKWLEDQKKRMDLNRQTTILAKEEERFDNLLQFEDLKTKIAQADELGTLRDESRAKSQVRQLDMDATKQEHDRAQLEQNKRLAITLGKEEELAANEVDADKEAKRLAAYEKFVQIQQGSKNQEFSQLLELAKVLPSLPPSMQQAMLAALKPEMAAMFVAAQQATGLEQQVALQKEHAKELGTAHTQGTQQAVQLLAAIVQQAGNVLTAKATPQQPPRTLPHVDPDATEGDAQ